MCPSQRALVGRDDLASSHDHDPVDVTLDRHHLEREPPGHAVPIAVEGNGLVLVHRSRRTDHAGVEPMAGSGVAAAMSSASRSLISERAEERLHDAVPLGLATLAEERVQLVKVGDARARAWRTASARP